MFINLDRSTREACYSFHQWIVTIIIVIVNGLSTNISQVNSKSLKVIIFKPGTLVVAMLEYKRAVK